MARTIDLDTPTSASGKTRCALRKEAVGLCRQVLLTALIIMAITVLASCGQSSEETQESQDPTPEEQATAQNGQFSEQEETIDEKTYAFEVADCHLKPEKMYRFESVPGEDPEYPGGIAMSFLMEESEAPVYVTPFGQVSGFSVMLSVDDMTMNPVWARFEQTDDVEGYGARVTFYYRNPQYTLDVRVPDSLYYMAHDDESSRTYWIELDDIDSTIEDGDDWPDAMSEYPDLEQGNQVVSLESDLVLPSDSLVLHDMLDDQVEDLIADCLQNLAGEGAIDLPKEGDPNEYFTFDQNPELVFTDNAAEERLTSDLSIDLDDVVFYLGKDVYGPGTGVYLNPVVDSEFSQYPRYYPASYFIEDLSWDSFDIPEDKADKFSDSLDECQYVVACMGLVSRIDEDFYDIPTADRVVVTTIVVVMDAQTREFVHIYTVGTDAPPGSTDHTAGYRMTDEAREYMIGLL